MTPEELEQVASVFRSEVMTAIRDPYAYPPPSDLDAERVLCVAAIDSRAEGLAVQREDFYSPLHGACYDMACTLSASGRRPTLEPICAALKDQGYAGSVERELLELRWRTVEPFGRDTIEAASERVIELAARRRLLRRMAQLDAQLRTDAVDYAQACHELTEHIHTVNP